MAPPSWPHIVLGWILALAAPTVTQSFLTPDAFVAAASFGTSRTAATTPHRRRLSAMSSSAAEEEEEAPPTYLEVLSQATSAALGRTVRLAVASGGGGVAGGGGGTTTGAVVDPVTGTRYFVKTAAAGQFDMLQAEYYGVRAMAQTQTIRVPTPIAVGIDPPRHRAFGIWEYLSFTTSTTAGGSQYALGQQLARMHRTTASNGKYGFHVNNTIGATLQPNLPWMEDWADFWDVHRLGHMLQLTGNAGLTSERVNALRQKTRELLSHQPVPSLLHGDLWGGNQGFCRSTEGDRTVVVPCIFDPATYYGDREADVAMTYLFGGFTPDFYRGYQDEWPLSDGHEQRRTTYNLYHILNHDVLFGGSYIRQARGMIDTILKY